MWIFFFCTWNMSWVDMVFEFLLIIVQQVESFPLTLNTRNTRILLEAKDNNCLVLVADQELQVYSLKGALLASFKDHTRPISSICVVGWFLICTLDDKY